MEARKLPSGSWNCRVFSHYEEIKQPDGTVKKKRIDKSFTCTDPSRRGKRECERMAADWAADKEKFTSKKHIDYGNMTLSEAIDKYISSRECLKRSVTTIESYRSIQRNAFPDLMQMKLKDLDEEILQDAIEIESQRPSNGRAVEKKPISAKLLRNEWGLVSAVLHKYAKHILFEPELPQVPRRIVELPLAADVMRIVRGTDIELPVLLAMWLSFSMSEIRGLTKSKSISGDYLTIKEVVVHTNRQDYRKEMAKNPTRNRRHHIPPYIKDLIDKVDGDVIVPMSPDKLYKRWVEIQRENNMDPITFHDLRHLNASVMALLRVPDKYAQERGGWKSDRIMKEVYMQTFSEERVRVDNMIDKYFEDAIKENVK